MVRKRRRKKLPVPERQPLVRPTQPNEVWSMDFVFDELANGRRVKTLTVVDDCSKEVVQIAVDTSIPALYVARVLDQVAAQRGLPKVIRTDNVLNARGVPTSGNSIARRSCWADRQMTKSNEQNRRRGSAAQGRLG